ncbi:MAG: 4Fe-4S binding protein [Nanoarchaeota archaeon]
MAKRKIIEIDESKCTGCGDCIPKCHEGALQIIDGKARLISDLFCDGLGACIGHCPTGAIKIIEREAKDYDERKVMKENIVPKGLNTIKAHLNHLKEHGAIKFYEEVVLYLNEKGISVEKEKISCGCPETAKSKPNPKNDIRHNTRQASTLRQWPVQLNLLLTHAPFFDNSDLLVAADCVGFADPNFHSNLLHGKSLAIGCPKLDDIEAYKEKLTEIFRQNNVKSVTVAIMEVPCCLGLYSAVEASVKASAKKIPIIKQVIGINGEKQRI